MSDPFALLGGVMPPGFAALMGPLMDQLSATGSAEPPLWAVQLSDSLSALSARLDSIEAATTATEAFCAEAAVMLDAFRPGLGARLKFAVATRRVDL